MCPVLLVYGVVRMNDDNVDMIREEFDALFNACDGVCVEIDLALLEWSNVIDE